MPNETIVAMAQADVKAVQSIEQQIEALGQSAAGLLAAGKYAELAIVSQRITKLQNEAAKAETAQLEAMFEVELADKLYLFQAALSNFVELRVHLSDGIAKAVTLHNMVAATKSTSSKPAGQATSTTTQYGKPKSDLLMEKHGECVLSDGITFAQAMETAKAKDKPTGHSNYSYNVRKKLLKHSQSCTQ
jgi:hypothetical protein